MKFPKKNRPDSLSQESMLMSPLDLRVNYQIPKSEMDLLPFLDLVLIGFLFFLLSSRLVFAPGIMIELPQSPSNLLSPVLVTDVLTVAERGENHMFFFRDAIYDYEGLRYYALSTRSESMDPESVLLIKMNAGLTLQMQTDLLTLARQMGFGKVQIAVVPEN